MPTDQRVRLPDDLAAKVNAYRLGRGMSFNAFMIHAAEVVTAKCPTGRPKYDNDEFLESLKQDRLEREAEEKEQNARRDAERMAAIREQTLAEARETAKLYADVPVSVQSFRELAQAILAEPDVPDWEPGASYEEFERRYEAQKWVLCHHEIDGRVTQEDHQATGLIRLDLIRDMADKELRCRSKEKQAAIDAEWNAKYAENAKRVKAMKGVTASDIDA